jgi:L-alanine-DL-glutamate epimerase-like enolase superfamily enzyme
MTIKRIETYSTRDLCFVRIVANDGASGWGQVAPYNADITATVLHRQVAPWVLGLECAAIDLLIDTVLRREHKFPGAYLCRALGGVETALWDLLGKRAGKSVCELLGGTPGPVRAYGSSMRRDISPEDEARRLCSLRDRFGFDAFKFRVGGECGNDIDEWPGRTEAIVPLVCDALGDDVAKLVDGNSGFLPPRAIEVGHMLEDNGVTHFEEPCAYWELEQTKQVTDALSLDVTGGEQDCEMSIWRQMIDMRAVDVVQPDVCYIGGISRTLQVAALAGQAGLPCTPHAANLSMVTMFTMHVLRAIPNAGKYLEFSIEGTDYYPWQTGLFEGEPYTIKDGQATVTDQPGFGIEIRAEWLAKSHLQSSTC